MKRSFQRILRAVFQDELHLIRIRPVVVDPPFLQAALQSQQVGGGLGNVHVNGVQLLNGGQGDGLIRRHDGAIGHGGCPDATGNRRDNMGVIEVDAGRFHHRLVIRDIGLGLFQGGRGIIQILLRASVES